MSDFASLKKDYYSRVPIPEGKGLPGIPAQRPYSDIVLHLPVLEYFASQCQHVVELGTRDAHSTVAFLAGCSGKVHSFDINKSNMVDHLKLMELPCEWEFTILDTGHPDARHSVPETDMMFFDTLHTYDHLKKELAYAYKSRRYLGFHDVATCGEFDKSGPNPKARGIMPAIQEFMGAHPQYRIVYSTAANNGLLILEK